MEWESFVLVKVQDKCPTGFLAYYILEVAVAWLCVRARCRMPCAYWVLLGGWGVDSPSIALLFIVRPSEKAMNHNDQTY